MLKRLRQLSLDPDLVSPSTMAALVDLSQKIDHGIKFDDIRNRIVITEDLMRDLRICGVPRERTPRDPPPPNGSGAPVTNNAWHRSHANSAAVLYRQSRRYMSSRASFPPGRPIYKPSKHSRELPRFPELSTNQCQLFAKHKFKIEGRGPGRRRPQTEPTTNHSQYYQHILGDGEVRRFQQQQRDLRREAAESPIKSTAEIKLPEIQTPTPSVREKYIVKWLYGEPNGKSPYITPKDMGFRLGKKRGTPVQKNVINEKPINNTPVTPFANEMKSSLS